MTFGHLHTRRQFLRYALGVSCGLELGMLAPGKSSLPRLPALVSRVCRESDSARRLGDIYLQRRPDEAHVNVLMERLLPMLQNEALSAHPMRLKARLLSQSRRDFASDRTVQVDGWILSETEARLYALVALVSS